MSIGKNNSDFNEKIYDSSDISIDNAIIGLKRMVDKGEELYDEVHEKFKESSETSLLNNGSSRNAVEYSKTLATIRNSNISGAKALFDAVKEKELLNIKKQQIENENKVKTETNEILRAAMAESKSRTKKAIIDATSEGNEDILSITEKLANEEISKQTLNESETKIVSNAKRILSKKALKNNNDEDENLSEFNISGEAIERMLSAGDDELDVELELSDDDD